MLIFSVIIIIHEFGHYTFAKLGGIKVNEFSLGMGPRLFSFYAAGTRWSLKILPLGGSCMMEGEDGESEDESAFHRKPVLTRILTVFGGPLYNFILAFLLAVFVIMNAGFDPSFVTEVKENSPAYEAGLKEGDKITRFDGKKISMGRELETYLRFKNVGEKPVSIMFERNGDKYLTSIHPEKRDIYYLGFTFNPSSENRLIVEGLTETGALKSAGVEVGDVIVSIDGTLLSKAGDLPVYLSAHPLTDKEIALEIQKKDGKKEEIKVRPQFGKTDYFMGFQYNLERRKVGFGEAILHSVTETKFAITSTIDGLKMLITGRVKKEEIAGPIGITKIIGNSYEASKELGFMTILLNMSIISLIISANLGVMNLLPIPALDGGRLIFLFVEAIRRKPLDPNKEGMIHFAGFIALMALMAFVFYNDIMRFFIK